MNNSNNDNMIKSGDMFTVKGLSKSEESINVFKNDQSYKATKVIRIGDYVEIYVGDNWIDSLKCVKN